jgi:sulfopyruvate decarboxylase subunit alpha
MNINQAIYDALKRADIRPCVSVPCKQFAPLLQLLEQDPERKLIYPAREEEGLGICAGAYLNGLFPVLIIQNSGLGNLVNAYCSLNQFFGIPLFFMVSHRGGIREKIDAQKPMGAITKHLLDLLNIPSTELTEPDQVGEVLTLLNQYRQCRHSHALLLPAEFWNL